MIYRYLRFSTSHQDERQQINKIDEYLSRKGLKADATYIDEATKGDSGRKKANLYTMFDGLQWGDTLVISEISRVTRSGAGDLAQIIEQYFKPNGLQLIICNVGFEIDCSDINPLVEMQLMMLATFAKIEKQLIIDRTRNALAARKAERERTGHWISKSGNVCTKLGRSKGADLSAANEASIESKQRAAKDWRESSPAWQWVKSQIVKGKGTREILEEFLELAKHQPEVYCTRTGKPMTLPKLSQWKREILEELRVEAMD